MRIVKEAQERRNEILDAAALLFATKGFDSTTTGDILEKVNIARGTLYYHFKSKEEILDAVIARMIESAIQRASEIAGNTDIPFLSRLPAIILSLQMPRELDQGMKDQLHAPQNALMHQLTEQRLIAGVVPILDGWVQEGIREGLFHTEHSTVMLEMALVYACTMFDDLQQQSEEEKRNRIQGLIFHLERMLGAEKGVLQQAMMEIFRMNNQI